MCLLETGGGLPEQGRQVAAIGPKSLVVAGTPTEPRVHAGDVAAQIADTFMRGEFGMQHARDLPQFRLVQLRLACRAKLVLVQHVERGQQVVLAVRVGDLGSQTQYPAKLHDGQRTARGVAACFHRGTSFACGESDRL